MTIYEILVTYNREISYLLKIGDNTSAMKLCDQLYQYICGHDLISMEIEEQLRIFLLNRASIFLNDSQFNKVFYTIREYKRLLNNNVMPIHEKEILAYTKVLAMAQSRTGHLEAAIDTISETLESYPTISSRGELLLLKAEYVNDCDYPKIDISIASEALGEAEKKDDQALVAQAYSLIASILCMAYPALGIYFIRKAEIIFYDIDKKQYIRSLLDHALSSFIAYLYYSKRDVLLDEAKRLLKQVEPHLDEIPFMRPFYLQWKGIIENDVESLKASLDFFLNNKAYLEAIRIYNFIVGYYVNHKDYKTACKYLEKWLKVCYKVNDFKAIKYIKELYTELSKENVSVNYDICSFIRPESHKTTILDILDEISIKEELWELDKSPIRSLFPYHIQEGMFETCLMPDDITQLIPMGLYPYIYYRGQNGCYSPCKPSIYRGLTESQILVERLKYAELKIVIGQYPLTELYNNGFAIKMSDDSIQKITLSIDNLALAQHYGIKTELMDLTVNKFVAAFFAVTKYDDKNDIYSPIEDGGKEGAFYFYRQIPMHFNNFKNETLRAVGLQPFSRPGEQAGFVLKMHKDEDLNKLCQVKHFYHDINASHLIYNYINRGNKLFPNNVLESKANIIKSSKIFSQEAYRIVKSEFYKDVTDDILYRYLNMENISLCENSIVSFTEKEKEDFYEKWKNGGETKFISRINFRTVRY